MKIAVIFVGSHFAGKSRTINTFLKPKLEITSRSWLFKLDGKDVCVLSQSFEESGRDPEERIDAYSHLDLLVLAARPDIEKNSKLEKVEDILHKRNFIPRRLCVVKGDDKSYELLANKALELLRAKA